MDRWHCNNFSKFYHEVTLREPTQYNYLYDKELQKGAVTGTSRASPGPSINDL